jgi:hypothetical protein
MSYIKTLVLEANGLYGRKHILKDTVLGGVLGFELKPRYENLSYILDWRNALCKSSKLDVTVVNVYNLVEFSRCLRNIAQYPLIIVLHSAGHAGLPVLLKTAEWFKKRCGKLVVFVGNEYKRMASKIRFICSVEADYVCSQLPIEAARWLYAGCSRSQILSMPHALNPKLYYPDPHCQRSIDVGFVGNLYHNVIGDMERTNLVRFFQTHGAELGITCDIRTQRLPRSEWCRFLNMCKGVVGGEAGTYYLDKTDQIISDVTTYLNAHPTAPFEEIFERFFKGRQSPVSGKTISSRHFEAIGTKTCQILIEGHYCGILVADEHFIGVKKDLSNIDDVVERFKDDTYRTAMVERTYEYVTAEHTYQHRVESLLKAIVDSGL